MTCDSPRRPHCDNGGAGGGYMQLWKAMAWVAAIVGSAAIAQEATPSASVEDQIKQEDLRAKQLANDETERANSEKKRQAILDSLPTSSTTGAVSVKEGAGQAEANVLAAGAASELAETIAAEIRSAADAAAKGKAPTIPEGVACAILPELADKPSPVSSG